VVVVTVEVMEVVVVRVIDWLTIFIRRHMGVEVLVKVVVVMVVMSTIDRMLRRNISGIGHEGGHSRHIRTDTSGHWEGHNGSTVGNDSNNSESRFGRHIE